MPPTMGLGAHGLWVGSYRHGFYCSVFIIFMARVSYASNIPQKAVGCCFSIYSRRTRLVNFFGVFVHITPSENYFHGTWDCRGVS